jgi:hypothetical protein
MEIKSNLNTNGVSGLTPSTRPVASRNSAQAESSFADADALNAALKSTPDSRPEAVSRAQQLINDPNYPSSSTVDKVSQLLAEKLTPGSV